MIRRRQRGRRAKRLWSFSTLLGVGFSLACFGTPATAAGTAPSCGWQYSSLLTNLAWPDSNAEYWITPFTAQSDLKITVRGVIPKARYFSITAYNSIGTARRANEIHDTQITPGANGTYTVTVKHSSGPNAIVFPSASNGSTGYLAFRVYLPAGTVQLPSLTYTSKAGTVNLRPCSSYTAPNNIKGVFNNPDNRYVELFPPAPGSNTVAVISGKAPTQVRYWSLCSYSWNTAVVDCRYDGNTVLTGGYYHIVLGQPSQKAAIVSAGYTFLQYAGLVMLRELLGNQLTGDYAPATKTCAMTDSTCIGG